MSQEISVADISHDLLDPMTFLIPNGQHSCCSGCFCKHVATRTLLEVESDKDQEHECLSMRISVNTIHSKFCLWNACSKVFLVTIRWALLPPCQWLPLFIFCEPKGYLYVALYVYASHWQVGITMQVLSTFSHHVLDDAHPTHLHHKPFSFFPWCRFLL